MEAWCFVLFKVTIYSYPWYLIKHNKWEWTSKNDNAELLSAVIHQQIFTEKYDLWFTDMWLYLKGKTIIWCLSTLAFQFWRINAKQIFRTHLLMVRGCQCFSLSSLLLDNKTETVKTDRMEVTYYAQKFCAEKA